MQHWMLAFFIFLSPHSALASWQAWEQYKARQIPACKAEQESTEIRVRDQTEFVFVFFHAYAITPAHLKSWIPVLTELNSNVLFPRFRGHGESDPKALDEIHHDLWLEQGREVLAAAKPLGKKVILMGFSLGGMVATRLALENPDDVHGLVLLSPAWDLGSGTRFVINIGDALGFSKNDLYGDWDIRCGDTYVSSHGGHEVLRLARRSDWRLEDLRTPTVVATGGLDFTISNPKIQEGVQLLKTRLPFLRAGSSPFLRHMQWQDSTSALNPSLKPVAEASTRKSVLLNLQELMHFVRSEGAR